MLDARTWVPREGDPISIWLEDLDALSATVIWVEEGRAGLAFDQLLHEAVYDRLCQVRT